MKCANDKVADGNWVFVAAEQDLVALALEAACVLLRFCKLGCCALKLCFPKRKMGG